MWTCLSTALGSAVESTAHREGCQSVLGEWPCLNNCEEWVTLDRLDFICAPVAQNLLQTEPNLVKVFFGCWLLTAPGIQLAGVWNQGSGRWICWSERRQQPKEAGALPELQEMQRFGGQNKLQASFELFGTAGFVKGKGNSNCVDFSWEGCFDTLLQHLTFTELCKMFQFFLGACVCCH